MQNRKVAIVMGSDSDWPVVKGACSVLKDFGVEYEARILSAHRTPAAAAEFAKNARANGCGGAVETRCGDLLEVVDECGDVVIANIIADAILQLAAPVRARIADGGVFIASGIAVDRRDEVEAALTGAEYEILDAPVKGEWAAFAARKR